MKSRNIVSPRCCWRRTAGIIACWECPSRLNLPDRCNRSTRGFSKRRSPTQASAVISPVRDSFMICARSRRHLCEATNSAASVHRAGWFHYQDTGQDGPAVVRWLISPECNSAIKLAGPSPAADECAAQNRFTVNLQLYTVPVSPGTF